MKKYVFSFLLACCCTSAYTQLREMDLELKPMVPKIADFQSDNGAFEDSLPLQYSLKKYCPVPNNQQQASSTVFQSVCYGAMTMIYAIQHQLTEQKDINRIAFSAMYGYNQLAENCNTGMTFHTVFEFLKNKGTTLFSDFEQSYENAGNCSIQPNAAHHQIASQYRIKNSIKLFHSKTNSIKYKIQKSLVDNQPVIVGIRLPNNSSTFVGASASTGYYKPEGEEAFGHTFVVVGYDEQSFELMNSWGTQWGQNGFCKIRYEDFLNYCQIAYQIHFDTQPHETKMKPSKGAFEWRTPLNGIMQPVSFTLQAGKYYQTTQKSHLGQQFQLAVTDLQKGKYVYVLSQASTGAVNWLWPKNRLADVDAVECDESPWIPYDSTLFLIPNAQQAFVLSNQGKETYMFFILYSNQALNVKELMARLKSMEKDNTTVESLDKFEKAFQGLLTDWKSIQYDAVKPSFSALVDDKIVPLIFKVL